MVLRHYVAAAVVLVAVTSWGIGIARSASGQQGPSGYGLLRHPQTSGAVLFAERPGTGSATALLRQAIGEATAFFDGRRPDILGGFRDADDRRVEAICRATIQRSPVMGLAFAVVGGGTGTVGFAFDSPGQIARSLPRLLQLSGTQGGGPALQAPPAVNWRVVPYPDGSGQVKLPEGWRITSSYKGAVTAEGPHGRLMHGFQFAAYTRAAIANRPYPLNTVPVALPVADPVDPVSAVLQMWPQLSAMNEQSGSPAFRVLRVIESVLVPVRSPALAQSAFIHLEFEQARIRYRCISYVILGHVLSDGQWLYAESNVASRAEDFGQNLSVLTEIWNSAETAGWVAQERLDNAIQSLHEANEIRWQATRRQEATRDRTHDKWIEVIQGTRVVEDAGTGQRTHVDLGRVTEIVRTLNEHAGYERYQELPLWQLNR